MIIKSCKNINNEIYVPGDKSISHRAIMIGALSNGVTEIENFLYSKDCISTINCFNAMEINIETNKNHIKVYGKGLYGLVKPTEILSAGNSGTTARLLMGILSGQKFSTVIDGDSSLRKRPVKRIVEPLSLMGANFETINKSLYFPIKIYGGSLNGINYYSKISSAQVKSSIIFATLYANSPTTYYEPSLSRNHTELMINYFGGSIITNNKTIAINPVNQLNSQHIYIPGDISSASFFIVLTLLLPNSQLIIRDVGINPTRTGIIDILKKMGAKILIENVRYYNNEAIGDIIISSSNLVSTTIQGDIIPRLIDELPIIAVAATQAKGTTIVKDAKELKVKESNRISATVSELSKMGADIHETDDGFIINGPCDLMGAKLQCYNDHRIAMALSIAAKIAYGETYIVGSEHVDISFPSFYKLLDDICK